MNIFVDKNKGLQEKYNMDLPWTDICSKTHKKKRIRYINFGYITIA